MSKIFIKPTGAFEMTFKLSKNLYHIMSGSKMRKKLRKASESGQKQVDKLNRKLYRDKQRQDIGIISER